MVSASNLGLDFFSKLKGCGGVPEMHDPWHSEETGSSYVYSVVFIWVAQVFIGLNESTTVFNRNQPAASLSNQFSEPKKPQHQLTFWALDNIYAPHGVNLPVTDFKIRLFLILILNTYYQNFLNVVSWTLLMTENHHEEWSYHPVLEACLSARGQMSLPSVCLGLTPCSDIVGCWLCNSCWGSRIIFISLNLCDQNGEKHWLLISGTLPLHYTPVRSK